MKTIKIFITHTPNCENEIIENEIFYHIIGGSAFDYTNSSLLRDNIGINISEKNRSYCELTTQYWAWKNVEADYYGFFHYRRYLSFSDEPLKENGWGMVEEPFITEEIIKRCSMDPRSIRKKVENYDCLISKGIPTMTLNGFPNVYEHYKGAPELHIKDLDTVVEIIRQDYPYLINATQQYLKSGIFYPCNIFIMKKELFHKYSEILFDILEKFEQTCNMEFYSREGYRTIGQLGERILGIFYVYLKGQENIQLCECQTVYFASTKVVKHISPRWPNTVPIVLAANDFYVPILSVCLQSILNTVSLTRNYDIVVLHTDITAFHQKQLSFMVSQYANVCLDFVDVQKYIHGYRLQAKEHITTETFYRFLILEIMSDYKKVIYIDCDLVVKKDLSQLYDIDLGNNMIGAVKDADFQGQYNNRNSDIRVYCDEILKLKDPYGYFQAGVLLFNIQRLRNHVTIQQLFGMADTGIYRFSDQDILNIICEGNVTTLDMRWNLLTDCDGKRWKQVIIHSPHKLIDEYEKAREDPFIVHYAGYIKPWKNPEEDFSKEFWEIARTTEFYEVLLQRIERKPLCMDNNKSGAWGTKYPIFYKIVEIVLPLHSKRREYIKKMLGIRWS